MRMVHPPGWCLEMRRYGPEEQQMFDLTGAPHTSKSRCSKSRIHGVGPLLLSGSTGVSLTTCTSLWKSSSPSMSLSPCWVLLFVSSMLSNRCCSVTAALPSSMAHRWARRTSARSSHWKSAKEDPAPLVGTAARNKTLSLLPCTERHVRILTSSPFRPQRLRTLACIVLTMEGGMFTMRDSYFHGHLTTSCLPSYLSA